jgi:hypothetical protein
MDSSQLCLILYNKLNHYKHFNQLYSLSCFYHIKDCFIYLVFFNLFKAIVCITIALNFLFYLDHTIFSCLSCVIVDLFDSLFFVRFISTFIFILFFLFNVLYYLFVGNKLGFWALIPWLTKALSFWDLEEGWHNLLNLLLRLF